MPNLLLIESPGKLKKLSQILGSNWLIKASMGHIRQLAEDGEDALGFIFANGAIDCHYQPKDARSKKVLTELRQAVKQADRVYIATDDDREGETIGWHLQQELRLKNPQRVVYREITPQAVRQAIAHPRSLDQSLIAAGRARDCLDKLVGYKGSKHVVWRLNIGAKSMGRVQSATLHLLCQREREILAFQPQDYWSVWVEYQEGFKAFYKATPKAKPKATAKIEEHSDDAAEDQQKNGTESDRVTSQAAADQLVAIARSHPHQVIQIEGKVTHQSPPPPFITASLQQAAGSRLKFSPDKTMKVAQALYEAGLITYMRTDSVVLSEEFQQATRAYLQQHDPTNLPQKTSQHRASKNAQEAHEAIRPTDIQRLAATIGDRDQQCLYDLIWNRAVAAQCTPARLRKTRIVTRSGDVHWEARGQVIEFLGYAKYWNNLSADTQLPVLQPNQALRLNQAASEQKQTQPPPRYTEPKLVQLMERKGIGRPSTYAPTVKTLKDRGYVALEKAKLQPTALGLDLDAALEKLLPDLIQPEFTAQMEADLDAIAQGKKDWQQYLTGWNDGYFAPALAQATQQLGTMRSTNPAVRSGSKTQVSKTQVPKTQTAKTQTAKTQTAKTQTAKTQQQAPDPQALTDSLCPVCGAFLERHPYQKDGINKVMLRCAIPDHRRGKCKDVAFFESRGEFWSPKFGTLKLNV
jgi:DNA topoisomerase I